MRQLTWISLCLFLVCPSTFTFAATKEGEPDKEMLRLMELLRDWEMLKNLDLVRDLATVERVGEPSAQPGVQKSQKKVTTEKQK